MMGDQKTPHFDIHPSVVYQLGESLISDAVQALIELVKNCYDADATYAKVTIDTQGVTDIPHSKYDPQGGRIIIEDDGHGMNLEDINSGWLIISNRKKRELKMAKNTTPGGRTPLGDKGLGRLGVQRLGDNLEVFTKCEQDTGLHLGFSWLDFEAAPSIQKVDLHLDDYEYPRKKGTTIVVSDLKEIEAWKGQAAIKRLEQELSRMISPYKQIRDFMVYVEVDGKPLQLAEISDKVRSLAPVRYEINFDGNVLRISGKARLDYFRPEKREEAELFPLIAESDDGKAFADFLLSENGAQGYRLTRSTSKQWFVEFSFEKPLDSVDKIESLPNAKQIANPGSFRGEIDSFDLGRAAFSNQSVFDRISEFRDHIKDNSKIGVYRDGFAIRVEKDWLKLGKQWTSAGSYYGLKPENTLGYIALTARDNMDLEETTNREEFKDTPHYRNFIKLMNTFIGFTSDVQQFMRRRWVAFYKKRKAELDNLDTRKTVEEITVALRKGLAEAENQQKSIETIRVRLKAASLEAKTTVAKLASAKEITPQTRERITETLQTLEPLIEDSRAAMDKLSDYLQQVGDMKGMGQLLQDRADSLRDQMDSIYETVALGITAEALSHEIYNVADQLSKRIKSAEKRIQNQGINDRTILAFIEYAHSAVMALRKQTSFLSPSLRYIREKREDIDVHAYLDELTEFYHDRLKKNNISIQIQTDADKGTFTIRMNRGKLTQIIDNFILNSEYWLKEDIAQGRLNNGVITLEISRPFIRIYDTGRGIDPVVEHTLFEPFISAKARGQGRGLGLFVVKQLLDSETCNIGIIPERNQHKRLFKFQIDLRGAIHE